VTLFTCFYKRPEKDLKGNFSNSGGIQHQPIHHISFEIIQQNAGLATAQHFGKDRWLQHLCGST